MEIAQATGLVSERKNILDVAEHTVVENERKIACHQILRFPRPLLDVEQLTDQGRRLVASPDHQEQCDRHANLVPQERIPGDRHLDERVGIGAGAGLATATAVARAARPDADPALQGPCPADPGRVDGALEPRHVDRVDLAEIAEVVPPGQARARLRHRLHVQAVVEEVVLVHAGVAGVPGPVADRDRSPGEDADVRREDRVQDGRVVDLPLPVLLPELPAG
eukprot:CAMPEP_0114495070 /NCGR_PEP_ID=MMETSP0109-20121206/5003_1 /TAXON_ID=29199 /ORGANISM="Chlorarachnion reptans, Strain CCCM449" /LENGTH=221 /DNA_ID=CAMNT_0001672177 /DNA_START=547 /DNA_END=1209 /DNA_ORIENTATION=-